MQQLPAIDLLKLPGLRWLGRWRYARFALQMPLFAVAMLMVWDGMTGAQLAPKNSATVLVWVHYRGFLMLALLVVGNLFCMACPFMLPRNLARRWLKPRFKWPSWLRNKWLTTGLLVAFFFVYERFDLWASPWWTAWLIVAYFVAALLIDSSFQGAPFCKYVCPLGQFNMLSSTLSPIEVAVRQPQRCQTCQTKDCIVGRDDQPGCELWLFQPKKVGNLDCTMCLDCIHACPHDNIGLLARVPGQELISLEPRSGIGKIEQRSDFSLLMLVFTWGALLNAFGMISPVYSFYNWLTSQFAISSETFLLSVVFILALVIEPVVLLGGAAWLFRRISGHSERLIAIINRFMKGFLPIGIAMWTAHYAFHFIIGFWTILPVLRSLLAEAGINFSWMPVTGLSPLVPQVMIYPFQIGMILLGSVLSAVITWQTTTSITKQRQRWAWLPWALVIVAMAGSAMWLLSQPMDMRGILEG